MGVEDYNKQQLERLRDHKIAFDQEAMWAAMQKKKKRRGAFIFFTMALVALAIVFLTYGLYSYFSTITITENLHSQKTTIEKERNFINESNNAETTETSKLSTQNQEISEIEDNNSTELDSKFSSAENRIDIVNRTSQNLSAKSRSEAKGNLNSIYNNSRKPETSASAKDSGSLDIMKEGNNPSSTINRNEQKTTNSNSGSSSETLSSNVDGNRDNEDDTKTIESDDNLLNIQSLIASEFLFLESLNDRSDDFEELEIEAAPPIIKVENATKSRFHIGAYGGVGYLFRKVERENEAIDLEDETLEELSVGLELKYQLNTNFFVRSGIEYWHATDRKEESTYSISNLNEFEDIIQFDLAEGDKGIVVQSSFSRKHNIYQSYNIPAVIGWNTNNQRWNLFAEAGVLFNFKMAKRGETPSAIGGEGENYTIGSRSQISPLVGLGLSYSPSNKFELFARANWRSNQFVTNKVSIVQQSYGAIRGQVGIRIGI